MGLFDKFSGKVNNSQETNNQYAESKSASNAAGILLSSQYYFEYKNLFDQLYNVYGGKYKPFVFEMLLWSIENGHLIDQNGYYVLESARIGLPYLCETEREFDEICKIFNKLKQGEQIKNILRLSSLYGDYAQTSSKHPYKMRYWGNQLISYVNNGDIEAIAAILGINKENSIAQNGAFFGDGVIEDLYNKYEMNLRDAANNGNYSAMLFVAVYMTPTPMSVVDYNNQLNMILESTKGNTSDAWYWLADKTLNKINLAQMAKTIFKNSDITVTPEEEFEIRRLYGEYYIKGAEVNKGCTAVAMQEMVADWYGFGDYAQYGIPADYDKAVYWYRVLQNNGINISNKIEVLNNYWNKRT